MLRLPSSVISNDKNKRNKLHFIKELHAYVGDTAVLFPTKGMSGFFPKLSHKLKQLQIITVILKCIILVQVYLGKKKTCMNYFPTG